MTRSLHKWGWGFLVVAGCTTADKPTKPVAKPQESILPETTELLTYSEITENQRLPKAEPIEPALNDVSTSEEKCLYLIQRYTRPYRRLAKHLPKDKKLPQEWRRFLNLDPSDCQSAKSRKRSQQRLAKTLRHHSNKIGALVPLSGPHRQKGRWILDGIKSQVKDLGQNFEERVVTYDSGQAELNTLLAQLVFLDRVAIIIGGSDPEQAKILNQWSDPLLQPMILMSPETKPSRFAFQVFPREKYLALTLAKAVANMGIKTVAWIEPRQRGGQFNDFFRLQLEKRGVKVRTPLTFTIGDFDSMESTVKTLLKVNRSQQPAAYRQAFRDAKDRARSQGQQFNARNIVLKPVVHFDALFLPADFKTTRHFVKLLQYYGLEKTTMIGNYEWRTLGLIKPAEPFLEGSLFADFVGNYRKFPKSIRVPTISSPFLADPRYLKQADYKLIGYQATALGLYAMRGRKDKRYRLFVRLKKSPQANQQVFGGGSAFTKRGTFRWPAFLFTVEDNAIKLHDPNRQPAEEKKTLSPLAKSPYIDDSTPQSK